MTHVVRKDVERAVVGVCLLLEPVPEVVLRDEVSCTWVETACEEAGHEEVDEGIQAKRLQDHDVKA